MTHPATTDPATDPGSYPLTDLDRILGYRGAIDDRPIEADAVGGESIDGDRGAGELVSVGPELYLMPFWTKEFCAAVIRAAEATGAFLPDPDDPVPGHEVSLAVISPRLFESVQDDIGLRVWPRLQEVWPLIEYRGLRDAFVIRYAVGEQESLRLHQDVAQVSATVRLNDDYEGAELCFPRQGYDNRAQPVGSLLAWPSLVTHPHESATLRSGTKYGLTIWCELPGDAGVY